MKFSESFASQISIETSQQLIDMAHHRGFKMLNANTEQIIQIVQKKYAEESFKEIMDSIALALPHKGIACELDRYFQLFKGTITEDYNFRIFLMADNKKHLFSIAKFFYYKKKDQCLIAHRVAHFSFELLPSLIKMLSSKGVSSSIKVLGFGAHSKYQEKTEQFVEIERGIQKEDMSLLIRLSCANSKKADQQITQFCGKSLKI